MRKRKFQLAFTSSISIICLTLGMSLSGCGEDSGNQNPGSGPVTSLNGATSVTGLVMAPNGRDRISGATVFIPGAPTTSSLVVNAGRAQRIITTTCSESGVITCEAPEDEECAASCSCPDGSYVLDSNACPRTATEVRFEKGGFTGSAPLNCAATGTCPTNVTARTDLSDIAIVTGAFDSIEDVLAKLGYGRVNENGHLVPGSETFALYKGGSPIDHNLTDAARYQNASVLFGSLTEMQKYRMILIDCGANENTDIAALQVATAREHQEAHQRAHQNGMKFVSADVASRLRAYVEGGGILYVTDQAYDYIERAFPAFMDFEGSEGTLATSPEETNFAQIGAADIVTDASVMDPLMRNWLSQQTSNVTTSATPTEYHCETTVNGSTGSLNENQTIHIGDFGAAWSVMHGKHTESPDAFIWIQGPVTFQPRSTTELIPYQTAVRPLTASQKINGRGCIIFSSHHTAKSCATTGFWPQERILQYLIFEGGSRCVPN